MILVWVVWKGGIRVKYLTKIAGLYNIYDVRIEEVERVRD
jgi:hypothetical protein